MFCVYVIRLFVLCVTNFHVITVEKVFLFILFQSKNYINGSSEYMNGRFEHMIRRKPKAIYATNCVNRSSI